MLIDFSEFWARRLLTATWFCCSSKTLFVNESEIYLDDKCVYSDQKFQHIFHFLSMATWVFGDCKSYPAGIYRSGVFILNFKHILCTHTSSVSIVNFERVIAGWITIVNPAQNIFIYLYLTEVHSIQYWIATVRHRITIVTRKQSIKR